MSEWERLKEALQKPATPEAMKAAAEAFRRYTAAGGSRPMLVSLSKGKEYPTAIPVEKIPDELERNPSFYRQMQRVIK